MGGLSRRGSYIQSIFKQERNVLVLDAGNVFSSPGLQGQIKAEVMLEGMQIMSYNIFNLGYLDFIHGLEFLIDNTDQFSLSTVNANVVYEDTGEHITAPHLIKKIGILRVGFIGVVAKRYESEIITATSDHTRTIEVNDVKTTLQTEVNTIKNKVDLIVVLASVGLKQSIDIAKEIEGIDVIICSDGEEMIDNYLFFNGVYIVKAGYDGKYVGNLTLGLNMTKHIAEATYTNVELDNSFSEDDDLEDLLDEYHARLEKELKDELLNMEQEAPDTGWYYVGSSACMGCHVSQSIQWSATDHADAFRSLIDSEQEYDPECTNCHTTGFGYTDGFIISDETPEMEGVQCEMCHGARGKHVETQLVDFNPVSEATCLPCHTEENSPEFNYDIYYPTIKH